MKVCVFYFGYILTRTTLCDVLSNTGVKKNVKHIGLRLNILSTNKIQF